MSHSDGDDEEFTVITNPFYGASEERSKMNEENGIEKRANPNYKKGLGTLGIASGGAGVAILMYALLMQLVASGKISLVTAGSIQAVVQGAGGAALASMDYDRLGTAFAASGLTLGGGLLIEQLRLKMAQRSATASPTRTPAGTGAAASPTGTPSGSTVAPGGRLNQRQQYGATRPMNQGAFAGARV